MEGKEEWEPIPAIVTHAGSGGIPGKIVQEARVKARAKMEERVVTCTRFNGETKSGTKKDGVKRHGTQKVKKEMVKKVRV